MALRYSKPLRIKGMAPPLLRPLPILISFLDLVDRRPHRVNPHVRQLFAAHLRAFRATLIALGRWAALPAGSTAPLLSLCDRLSSFVDGDPARLRTVLRESLQDLHRRHGPELVGVAREHKDAVCRIFRNETGPLRLAVVHHDDTAERAAGICSRLENDCWYTCGRHHENDGVDSVTGNDLVLLVPSAAPIRKDLVQALGEHEIACLVLIRTGTTGPVRDMAALRVAHLYRKEGFPVMQGPPVPLRLYQAIDRLCLCHLAEHPAAGRVLAAPH